MSSNVFLQTLVLFFCKALIAHSHLCSTYFFNLPQNWYEYTVQTCMLSNLKGHQIPCCKRPPPPVSRERLDGTVCRFYTDDSWTINIWHFFCPFFLGGGGRRCDYRMSALLLTKLLSHYFYSVKLLIFWKCSWFKSLTVIIIKERLYSCHSLHRLQNSVILHPMVTLWHQCLGQKGYSLNLFDSNYLNVLLLFCNILYKYNVELWCIFSFLYIYLNLPHQQWWCHRQLFAKLKMWYCNHPVTAT